MQEGRGSQGPGGGQHKAETPAQPLDGWSCLHWGSTALSCVSPFSPVPPSSLPSNRFNCPPLTQATLSSLPLSLLPAPPCIPTVCQLPELRGPSCSPAFRSGPPPLPSPLGSYHPSPEGPSPAPLFTLSCFASSLKSLPR